MSVVSFPANTTTLLVNTLFTSKIVYLPAISTVNAGSIYYIKDICGNAATLPIYIYPSGTDTLENSSATYTILNINFGAVMVTPDGISNWMILQNYNSNAIAKLWNAAPAAPASLTLLYNPLTTYLTASWTKSGYAATYAVIIYTNSSASTVGATSFQSFPTVIPLTVNTTNAISQTYYYATVTATNPLGTSATTTSPFLQVVYLPLVPSAVTAVFSFPLLTCTWSTGLYATSYTIIFYNNIANSTTGGTAVQIFTGNTGTSQAASVLLVNAYYYYATVTSVNSSGNSAIVTSSNTVQTAVSAGPIASVSVSFYFPNSSIFPTIVCTWTASVNANTYTVRYYESVTPVVTGGSLFETDTGITGLTYSSTTLLVQNNYYYATVTGIGTYGNSATVTSGSYAQAIIYPLSTASVTVSLYFPTYSATPAITCTWIAVTTAATYTIVFYQNNSASTSGGTTFETNTLQTGTTKNTTTTLVQNKYYYATVVAVNAYGSSPAVLSTSYIEANLTPLTTASVSITFSFPTYSSTPTVTCTWSSVATAATFTIIFYETVSPATTGGTTFETDVGETGTSKTSTTTLVNGNYYYATVTSVNAYDSSSPVTSASYVQAYMTALPTSSVFITFSFPTYSSTPTVTCTWSSVATAATFTVIFYESASPATTGGTMFETNAGQTGTSVTSTTTLVNSNYYYATVTSVNSYASSTAVTSASYVQAYMTALPTASVAISFSFPTYSSTPSFTCTWSAVATAATYTIKFYQTVSPATTGGTLVETNTGKTGTSYTSLTVGPTNLYYYYATVISVNTYAPSVEVASASSVQAYMTALPTATATMSFSGNTVTCTWSAVATAASYSIVFYSSVTNVTTGGTSIEIVTSITGTSRTSTAALTSGYYYYATVTSVNTYASSVPFTTTNAIQATILPTGGAITLSSILYPASGSVTITAAALATGYTVYISTTTSTAQSVYSFTTTTTGSAVAFTPSPSLTSNSSYYAISVPYNTYGNGQQSVSAYTLTALYVISSTITFTPAGATGLNGPTLSQCRTAYSSFGAWVSNSAYFNMTTQGNQLLTVPVSATYTVVSAGAGIAGSSGAIITTNISLTQGQVINIIVGQSGTSGAGSGGSFLHNQTTNTILIATGGGGGAGSGTGATNGSSAVLSSGSGTNGSTGNSYSSSQPSSWSCSPNSGTCSSLPVYPYWNSSAAGGSGGLGYSSSGIYSPPSNGSFGGGGGPGTWSYSLYCQGYTQVLYTINPNTYICNSSGYYSRLSNPSQGSGGGGGGYSGGNGGSGTNGPAPDYLPAGGTGGSGGYSYSSSLIVSSSTTNTGQGYISIIPNNSLPYGGSIIFASTLTVTSGSVTITSYLPATSFTVYISTTQSSANSVYSFVTTTSNTPVSFTSTFSPGVTHYAVLLIQLSSGPVSFTLSSAGLAAYSAVPYGGSIVINSGFALAFGGTVTITAATGATNYTVYISTTTSTANSVYNFNTSTTGSPVSTTPPSPLTVGTYYAIFISSNSNGSAVLPVVSPGISVTASYSYPAPLIFTPAGATLQNGPTLSQCTTAYASFGTWVSNTGYFNMTTQGVQIWTVPETRNYTVICAGGGSGAVQTAVLSLTLGQVLNIVIGQVGSYGGAGGSFVLTSSGSPLIASGGGGGGWCTAATLSTTGLSGSTFGPNPGGAGGTNGSGGGSALGYTSSGTNYSDQYSSVPGGGGVLNYPNFNGGTGGGAGYAGNGQYYSYPTYGGYGGGGANGNHYSNVVGVGFGYDYGGGGAGSGGYSGGGGGSIGGGGGSYCSVTPTSSSVSNSGQGYVSIT